MKILLLVALFIGGSALRSEEPAPLQLLRISGQLPAQPTISVFSGRKTTLVFHRPVAGEAPPTIVADLFQVSGQIAAPLARDLPVTLTATEAALDLTVPAVERTTNLLLVLRAPIGGAWRKCGHFRLTAFPSDSKAEWQKLGRFLEDERGLGLAVFGENQPLRDFLRAAELPFTDLGPEIPSSLPAHLFVFGLSGSDTKDRAAHALAETPGLLFVPDSPLLPGVYAQPGSPFRVVTLPLLASLADDPRAQNTLLELLQTALQRPENRP